MLLLCLNDHSDHSIFNWSDFPNSKMACAKTVMKSEELSLSLTRQGLLRFIELKTFRGVTGYSISIVNMSKQDDGSITGEILHRLDYPSQTICLQQSTNRFDHRSSDIDTMIIKVQ